MDDALKLSYKLWAITRVVFLQTNCGIPLSELAEKLGLTYSELKQFIKNGNEHFTDDELLTLNKHLDLFFLSR